MIQENIMMGSMPNDVFVELRDHLCMPPFIEKFVAVRSSGTDEDSTFHSFAG